MMYCYRVLVLAIALGLAVAVPAERRATSCASTSVASTPVFSTFVPKSDASTHGASTNETPTHGTSTSVASAHDASTSVASSSQPQEGPSSSATSEASSKGPSKPEKFSPAWIEAKSQELFNRTLTKEEYYERDWMWIRCRNSEGWRYDMGGSWFGDYGHELEAAVKKRFHCGYMHYNLQYVNGAGWGDATLKMHVLFRNYCDAKGVVQEAMKLAAAKKTKGGKRREFYIWNCRGFEDVPNFGHEWPGKSWPSPGTEVTPSLPKGAGMTKPDELMGGLEVDEEGSDAWVEVPE